MTVFQAEADRAMFPDPGGFMEMGRKNLKKARKMEKTEKRGNRET